MELVADTLSNAAAVHAQPSFGGSQAGMSVGGASSPGSVRGSEVGESIKGLPPAPQHTIQPQVRWQSPQGRLTHSATEPDTSTRAHQQSRMCTRVDHEPVKRLSKFAHSRAPLQFVITNRRHLSAGIQCFATVNIPGARAS
jgi:hypothetical protein